MKIVRLLLPVLVCLAYSPATSNAADAMFRSVGLKYGISATATENYFHEYAAAAVYQLPWEVRSNSGWGMSTLVDMSAGSLRGEHQAGFLGSAGPAFGFGKKGFPVEMDAGVSAAYLGHPHYGGRDLNGHIQFITHVGFDFRFGDRFGVEYRFQHLSNAGINGDVNPGLNLHVLGLNWYFAQ
jgi:hypothetical protein